ncbi:MAG TPA: ATP-binding protein [Burkholderiaceae bacterium]|nr:ATP-binding protein [Burkholderiaceae bacterium]
MSHPTEGRPWSLRGRLLLLTTAVTATAWLVGGAAMFIVGRHVSDLLFDQRLRDIAGALLTFADHEISELQASGADVVHIEGAQTLGARYRYQIWSEKGELLLVSVGAPRTPFAPFNERGFSTRTIGQVPMRMIVLPSGDGSKLLEVAEPLSARSVGPDPDLGLLGVPLLLSLAFLIAVSAWLVRRATRALGESARQVTQRTPDDLRPLDVANAPIELTPIVAAVNSLFARIENALAAERRFTSAAAHELRTPLAAIKIQAQVALRLKTEEERQKALERLLHSIDTASHTIDQLLTVSRIDGLIALRARASCLQLDAIAAHVIDEMRPIADRRGQTIIEELGAADIDGLEFGVAVLLRNLIDNAVRYGPTGGPIRVRTGVEKGRAFAMIEDAGPGIAPEQRKRVFERFYRVPNSPSADGCGIGLAIVQAVVDMHRAQIELVRSDLGGLRAVVRFAPAQSLAARPSTSLPTAPPISIAP